MSIDDTLYRRALMVAEKIRAQEIEETIIHCPTCGAMGVLLGGRCVKDGEVESLECKECLCDAPFSAWNVPGRKPYARTTTLINDDATTDLTACTPHMLLRCAHDLRKKADKRGYPTEQARLLREAADLVEVAAAREKKEDGNAMNDSHARWRHPIQDPPAPYTDILVLFVDETGVDIAMGLMDSDGRWSLSCYNQPVAPAGWQPLPSIPNRRDWPAEPQHKSAPL